MATYGYTESHDKNEVYSKNEIDNGFYNKGYIDQNLYDKSHTYSKDEVNGKIPGHILSGTTEPAASLGENGDIYIKYET